MAVPDFEVSSETLAQITQSVQEMRKMSRSIENIAFSFIPLTDNPAVLDELNHINEAASNITKLASSLYQRIARKALGNG